MSYSDNNTIPAERVVEPDGSVANETIKDAVDISSKASVDDYLSSPVLPDIILNSRIVDFSSNDEKAVINEATIMMPSSKVNPAVKNTGAMGQLLNSSPIPPAESSARRNSKQSAPAVRKKQGIPKHIKYMAAVACAVLAVIVTAIIVGKSSDKKDYDGYVSLAHERYASGDFSEALAYLRKAGALKSSDEVTSLTVDCYIAEGNYDMALEVLRSMDSSDPLISAKIQQVEAKKLSVNPGDGVTILGVQYPASTTSLVLNNMGLDSSSLSEISKLYSLTSLTLADNCISDFSVLSSLGGLMYLDLSRNSISDISAIASFTSLRTLILDGNKISDFSPVYSLKGLTTLSIKGMNISTAKCDAISAALPGCAVHSEATLSDSSAISLGGASFSPDAESIVLSNSGITDISALAACTKLKYLDLSSNNISDLSPLLSIPGLETLVLSDNNISNIYPLMGISSLQCVHLERNFISDITALTALSDLREIYLSGNSISSCAGISNLNYLETLDLSYSSLTDTVLDSLNSAYSLRLLNLEGNEELTGNAVDALLSHLPNCAVTGGSYPHIISVSGSEYLDNLTVLNLAGMGIKDISFLQKFKDIETLDLSNNLISNIYSLDWLKNPADLKNLNLSGNSVSDISCLSKLKNLETLDLSGNPISIETPLLTMTSLRSLNLTGCNLSEEAIQKICVALPNCAVSY